MTAETVFSVELFWGCSCLCEISCVLMHSARTTIACVRRWVRQNFVKSFVSSKGNDREYRSWLQIVTHLLMLFFFYHHLCSPHCDYWMSQAYTAHRMFGTMAVDEPCLCNIRVWLPASSKKLSTQPRRENGFSQEQPKFHHPNVNIVLKTLHTSSFWNDLCFWAYILLLIAWNLSLSDWGLCGAS